MPCYQMGKIWECETVKVKNYKWPSTTLPFDGNWLPDHLSNNSNHRKVMFPLKSPPYPAGFAQSTSSPLIWQHKADQIVMWTSQSFSKNFQQSSDISSFMGKKWWLRHQSGFQLTLAD